MTDTDENFDGLVSDGVIAIVERAVRVIREPGYAYPERPYINMPCMGYETWFSRGEEDGWDFFTEYHVAVIDFGPDDPDDVKSWRHDER